MVTPSSFDPYDPEDVVQNLTGWSKLWYKCKAEPLVPIGVLLTTGALIKSAIAIRRGNHKQANRFFTARVVFQGCTIAALIGGSYYMQSKMGKSKAELDAEKAARRKELWLEELERQQSRYK
ncbi:hypoxia induced protein conserved region-domain-containing protein [Limtongia smithiae]|uniref:hypoxia induced protein conserved region-domain-containing protein n=1 Tax=Limtongia smithiae TaxID=1125753 RepID=UPI0034CEA9D0